MYAVILSSFRVRLLGAAANKVGFILVLYYSVKVSFHNTT